MAGEIKKSPSASSSVSSGALDDPGQPFAPNPSEPDPNVPCDQKTLFARLSSIALDVGTSARTAGLRATPLPNGDILVGWHAQAGGDAHISRFSNTGARVAADILIPGTMLMALASDGINYAALIRRGATASHDELHWVLVNGAGAVVAQQKLVGGVDRTVVGNQWLDDESFTGRWSTKASLAWTGNAYVAYYTMRQHFVDNDHQGDQQRVFNQSGALSAGGWDWGCSHSLDLGMAAGGGTSHPICVSDCYPSKGVIYRAATSLFEDPSGNCGGSNDTVLGGTAYVGDTLWVAMHTPTTRTSIDVGITPMRASGKGATIWLSDLGDIESGVGLTSFGSGLLSGWRVGNNRAALLALTATGASIGTTEITANASTFALFEGYRTEFFELPDHDAAWVTVVDTSIHLVRVDACI